MLIYLRHGESEANRDLVMCGQINTPLTDQGREEALEAGDTLAGYHFDHIFVSDLERAQDTARLVMSRNTHPNTELTLVEDIRERSGGALEGMTYAEIRKLLPPKKYKLWQRDYYETPPQGESMSDVEDRVVPWVQAAAYPGARLNQNILIVSHATVMKVLIGHVANMEHDDIVNLHIENAMPYFYYNSPPD